MNKCDRLLTVAVAGRKADRTFVRKTIYKSPTKQSINPPQNNLKIPHNTI